MVWKEEKEFSLSAGFISKNIFEDKEIVTGKHTYYDTTVIAVNVPNP